MAQIKDTGTDSYVRNALCYISIHNYYAQLKCKHFNFHFLRSKESLGGTSYIPVPSGHVLLTLILIFEAQVSLVQLLVRQFDLNGPTSIVCSMENFER